MIFVDVIGGSKSQKKHVKNMVEFCVKTLMPRMNLDITVNLCKSLEQWDIVYKKKTIERSN